MAHDIPTGKEKDLHFAQALRTLAPAAWVESSARVVGADVTNDDGDAEDLDFLWRRSFAAVIQEHMVGKGHVFSPSVAEVGIAIIWFYFERLEGELWCLQKPKSLVECRTQVLRAVTLLAAHGAMLSEDGFLTVAKEYSSLKGLSSPFNVEQSEDGVTTIEPLPGILSHCDSKKAEEDFWSRRSPCPALGAMDHIVESLFVLFCKNRKLDIIPE